MSDTYGVARALIFYVALVLLLGMALGVSCWEGSRWVYRHVHVEVRK